MTTSHENPWNLSKREVDTMDAMVKHYCVKRASDALHLSEHTVRDHVCNAGQKMRCGRTILEKYLLWDRFRQKQQREQVIAATQHN